jgi:serine/threonine-protein kinase
LHKFCPVCGFPVSELSRKPADYADGTFTLPGGYAIPEMVGVGGMGVYRAEQKVLGCTVAVKVIHRKISPATRAYRYASSKRARRQPAQPIRTPSPSSTSSARTSASSGTPRQRSSCAGRIRSVSSTKRDPPLQITDVLLLFVLAIFPARRTHLGIIHRDPQAFREHRALGADADPAGDFQGRSPWTSASPK